MSKETVVETPDVEETEEEEILEIDDTGLRIVGADDDVSDIPALDADFFAQHEETEYVDAIMLIRNKQLDYEERRIYVRKGVEASDEIAIRGGIGSDFTDTEKSG